MATLEPEMPEARARASHERFGEQSSLLADSSAPGFELDVDADAERTDCQDRRRAAHPPANTGCPLILGVEEERVVVSQPSLDGIAQLRLQRLGDVQECG